MTRLSRGTLLLLLATSAAASGCHRVTSASGVQARELLVAKPDTGIALHLALLRDTVPARDTMPLEVMYAIVNGPRPTWFDNNPQRYQVLVTGPDGQPAHSLGGAGPLLRTPDPRMRMLLPAGASLVQRQDLRCVNEGAYSPTPASRSTDTCLAIYALDTPGTYRVIVNYYGPEPDSVLAAVERGQIRSLKDLPPWQALHLADTATFVVSMR